MAKSFTRLDKLLADRGITPSRERAQALILAAKVMVDGRPVTKSGHLVPLDCDIQLVGDDLPFVSRGGLKLQHAIETFQISLNGLVAMDVGASTGGFTDCLLQNGVKRVYAIDVGYGQLAWKLRQDPRVVVIERQNIRYLPPELAPEPVQVATVDTSFISLKLVIPAVLPFLDTCAKLIVLIKPQFEAGREHVGKGGVIRDPKIHEEVCEGITRFVKDLSFEVLGVTPSPILGPKGNREFLLAAVRAATIRRTDDPLE
jgi:23S rRNA (cytidine1920-2'-O)/16S rRNA (cytidine1409-2'-O)-methyltransferase